SALDLFERDALLSSNALGQRRGKDAVATLQDSLQPASSRLRLLRLRCRCRHGWGLCGLFLLLLLGLLLGSRLLGTACVVDSKVLERGNVGALFHQDCDRLRQT